MTVQAPGRIYPGTVVRIAIDFVDISDVAGDPATVTFKVMSPCGVISTYVYGTDSAVSKPATGQYVLAIPSAVLTDGGRWRWRVQTTGATFAYESDFIVQASRFATSSCCWGDYQCP